MCINLADWDQFGTTINLNYRKKAAYGTGLGGCCTIVLFLAFWSITLTMIGQIVFTPEYQS